MSNTQLVIIESSYQRTDRTLDLENESQVQKKEEDFLKKILVSLPLEIADQVKQNGLNTKQQNNLDGTFCQASSALRYLLMMIEVHDY